MNAPRQDAEYTESFDDVAQAEVAWIGRRRQAVGHIAADAPLVGLALSGGGIRSAAFNLGVLQALARKGLLARFDYLSTVSGGGYIGSCLTWLSTRAPGRRFDTLELAHSRGTVLDWLRAHGKYLITGRGLSGWTLAANVLAGTLLNLFVLVPLFLVAIAFASKEWFALDWPAWLQIEGASGVHAHDGFMLIALAGVVFIALYILTALVFALSTALPSLRRMSAEAYLRRGLGRLLAAGIVALAIGLLPVFTGVEEALIAYLRSDAAGEVVQHATWLGPMLTGGVSMWFAKRRQSGSSALPIVGISLLLFGAFTGLYHLAHHTALVSSEAFRWWLCASFLLALVCDINSISMHSYYRSRLAEAFLPQVESPTSAEAADHPALFRLKEVSPESGAPLHLINTTLNTTSSRNPKLRSRNGENLFLSPLFCGSSATGYRRTEHYLGGRLTLSTAFSVSGAAVDPDTYATKSRPISFLMALLNARLGIWVDNPGKTPRKWRWPAWYESMLREMFGRGLSETEAKVHLADGGHFENLGVYELLRRRCRFIVVSDAGADPTCGLGDLGQAIQRARADFGADVDICPDRFADVRADAIPERAHLLGKVTYADGSVGRILYVKARVIRHLSADIYAYWRANAAFPNEPTSDQFYGELQFDSYRELGLQIMSAVIGEETTVEGVFARWDDREDASMLMAERDVA